MGRGQLFHLQYLIFGLLYLCSRDGVQFTVQPLNLSKQQKTATMCNGESVFFFPDHSGLFTNYTHHSQGTNA